jgi:hypothetical protein
MRLRDYQPPIWLALFRYAACPFCNLRLHHLIGEHERIAAAGLTFVCVVPSPLERIKKYIERYKPPFDVLSDPEQRVYQAYAAETSWAGELRTAVNLPKAVRALVHAPNNPVAVDGPVHRMPAEFLIGTDRKLGVVHYGRTLDDGIPVDDAIAWAQQATGATEARSEI